MSGTMAADNWPVLGSLLKRLADRDDAANVLVVSKVDRLGFKQAAEVLAISHIALIRRRKQSDPLSADLEGMAAALYQAEMGQNR